MRSSLMFYSSALTSGQPRSLLRETKGEENDGKPVRMCERRSLHLWFPDHLYRRGGPPAPDRQPPGDGARGQDPHRDDRELPGQGRQGHVGSRPALIHCTMLLRGRAQRARPRAFDVRLKPSLGGEHCICVLFTQRSSGGLRPPSGTASVSGWSTTHVAGTSFRGHGTLD